jgi:pilus assembly protein TadC
MFCNQCGEKQLDDAKFCHGCGHNLIHIINFLNEKNELNKPISKIVTKSEFNTAGVASFLFGVISIFFGIFLLPQLAAILFGLIGIISHKKEKHRAKYLAIAGLCFGLFLLPTGLHAFHFI